MAFQFSLDSTRGELIDVVAPPPLEHGLLTDKSSSSEEIVISDEEREQLASSLSVFFLKLKQGENVLGIDYPWSALVDFNFDDLGEHDRTNLIAATITPDLLEDIRFVAQLISQGRKVQAGSNEQIQLRASVRRILRPFASSVPSSEPVVNNGTKMDCGFNGEVRSTALLHVANRYPYSGNLSYAPILASHSLVDGMTEVQYSAGSF